MENENDLVAIGDIVIDTFIRLEVAEVVGRPDTSGYKICLPFGEKIPYLDSVICSGVGNAPNAAVSSARLGLRVVLVSNLGDDRAGEDCISSLAQEKIGTHLVKIHKGVRTNQHFVLWYSPERTILSRHEEYEYVLPDMGNPKWIYFSSVNETAYPDFHNKVADYLEKHKEINFAFQPGKFEIKLGHEKLSRLYKRAKIFFCNVEEAEKILGAEDLSPKELLTKMHVLGPEIVVITDGPKGAYAYDGKEFLFMPPYPDPKPPYERTGAGDAFSSTIVGAMISEKTLPEALQWAGINSMSVVQEVGAQKGLLTKEKIEEYLKNAPEDYKAEKID
jgi:sugar/nucleoside kinase (ribokinase family)